jgi:hypothetical protein
MHLTIESEQETDGRWLAEAFDEGPPRPIANHGQAGIDSRSGVQ